MTLRISTAGLHAQGLAALLKRQQELAHTQQQMTSGNKLTRAADDPAGAAQAQTIDHVLASLDAYGRNANVLEQRLHLQEQAMGDAGDTLTRARELALQANSATMSQSNRKQIAAEIVQLRAQLLSVANRDDGSGRALFAGTRDGVVPFADAGGVVSYIGDDGQNQVDISPQLAVADTNAGSEVFLRVRTGNGEILGSAAAANTGTSVLQSTEVGDHATWPATALQLEFTAPDAYRIVDGGGTVLASGSYAPGDTINAAGVRVRLTGAPAAGDAYTLQPAPNQDIFATLQSLADALNTTAATPAERAKQDNAIGRAIGDISTAQDHLVSVRAATGSRLSAIDDSAGARAAQDESLRATLAGLRDTDYAQAASQLSLELTAIQAAQATIKQVQSLSLFDLLR
jgi:flagellar hook-associated protein 3 FlgL